VTSEDDELRALRERAYGRDPDIHLDPDSLERLRELESTRVAVTPDAVEQADDVTADPPEPEVEPHDTLPRPTPGWILWVSGLRRSTVLVAAGVILVAAALTTALVLVQRVQTDPLQVGASQVARLGVDESYEIPGFFVGAGAESEIATHAYQAFHGLRAVTGSGGFVFGSSPDSTCLNIYPQANITATADSFSGPLFGGCAAGDFPAIVQFTVGVADLPQDLVSTFPDSTGLQFVYDKEHDEVVVFSDR
jgi:hypothetical protein